MVTGRLGGSFKFIACRLSCGLPLHTLETYSLLGKIPETNEEFIKCTITDLNCCFTLFSKDTGMSSYPLENVFFKQLITLSTPLLQTSFKSKGWLGKNIIMYY